MLKSITTKIKEKFLKLRKGKNTNNDIELVFDNTDLANVQEEKITEKIKNELNECLIFINDITTNMDKIYPHQYKKFIELINVYINKFASDNYIKYTEVRRCITKLKSLKSQFESIKCYGKEKTELDYEEKQDLNTGLEAVETFRRNINVLDNNKLEKVIDITDSHIKKFSDYNYVKFDETRKCIRKLQVLKSDILTKLYYENECEEEKVYSKCS